MQNCSLPTPTKSGICVNIGEKTRMNLRNKSLSSLLPSGGRVGKPKKFLWSLLHLTCSWGRAERHCALIPAGNGEGTGLLGDSSEDERQITEKSLQLHSLSQNWCPPALEIAPLHRGLWMKGRTPESLTSVSPSMQEPNDTYVPGGADPDTGFLKATLLLEAESKFI